MATPSQRRHLNSPCRPAVVCMQLLAALAACGARGGAPDDTVCALASRSSHALLSSRFIGDGPCASVDRGLAGPVGSPLGSVGCPPVDGGSCALAGPVGSPSGSAGCPSVDNSFRVGGEWGRPVSCFTAGCDLLLVAMRERRLRRVGDAKGGGGASPTTVYFFWPPRLPSASICRMPSMSTCHSSPPRCALTQAISPVSSWTCFPSRDAGAASGGGAASLRESPGGGSRRRRSMRLRTAGEDSSGGRGGVPCLH